MIEVDALSKYYGAIPAVREISFQVRQGEITGFLGPNGAGKSTTMRILTGFTPATSGRATVAGFDVAADPLAVKRAVGYLPERVPLYDEMVVKAFLQYIAEIKGVPRRQIKSEAERVMARCGLDHMASRLIRNLSKGYRQRVGLAQSLIGNPSVLILDEPTVGLDPRQIVEIRTMIKGLAEDHTVLLSTHILPEVSMVCERVIIINGGKVVAESAMEDLARDGVSIAVEATGDQDKLTTVLGAVEGVAAVQALGPGRFTLKVSGDEAAVREAVAAAVVTAGLGLRQIDARKRTLEEVFIDAISADQGVSV